jgi:hypothetical protein
MHCLISAGGVRIFQTLLHLPEALPNSLEADLGTGLKILLSLM